MTTPRASDEFTVGFIGFFDIEDEGDLLGAAMVTNERGFPLEFRVSTPVRPSAIQRALYGSSLDPYVTAELLGVRLINDLKHTPDVILVNRLGGLDLETSSPLAFVARADSFVRQENPGTQYRRLEPQGGEGAAVAIVGSASGRFDDAVLYVSESLRHFDPVDAFGRMKTAVDVLAKTDERYR